MSGEKSIIILGIESSCDDTAAAVFVDGSLKSNVVANQSVHEAYGGVVPELASRQHQANIVPVVDQALKKAGVSKEDLSAIAVTRGPGLMGSLIVGVSFAKAFALGLNIPIIDVHHMHAHLMSNFIEDPKPSYPFLCLTVSGGHTEISVVRDPLNYEVIGKTRDDAAGEAFDKTGKMLNLPYPAGPHIDKLAKQGEVKFKFPMARIEDLDFSFSGLKTAIRYFLRDNIKENPNFIEEELTNICASVQDNIVEYLMIRLEEAVEKTGIREVAVAGGVSANSHLRAKLQQRAEKGGWNTYIPAMAYCTDNAAMIGMVGYYKFKAGLVADLSIEPSPRGVY